MLVMVCGVPGSGKSLALVKRFLAPALSSGREVYTNIDGLDVFNLSLYTGKEPESIDRLLHSGFGLKEFNLVCSRASNNSMIIIDEAQNEWNNRDFKDEYNKEALKYMTKHRHFGHDVIIATQNFEQVDIGIRRLGSVHYHLKRMSNIGLNKFIKVDVYNQCLNTDMKPVASEAWRIDKSIFGLYKSYEGSSVAEIKIKKNHNVFLRSPLMWFIAVVVAINIWNFARGGLEIVKAPIKATHVVKSSNPKAMYLKCKKYYCGDSLYVLNVFNEGSTYSLDEKNPFNIRCADDTANKELECN